jgi:hypothetical protein
MKLEIVSHVYCPPGMAFYAEMLKWQWASLVNHPCDHTVDYTVCYTASDRATARQIEECAKSETDNVYIRPLRLSPQQLFRRAIGRNIRALNADADVVWMTDVDYLFGFNCLNDTMRVVTSEDKLCMPGEYFINNNHATGDKMLEDFRDIEHPSIPTDLFTSRRQRIAIGGLQILGGEFARKEGYLKGTKYVEPVPAHFGFRSCKCDRWFRKHHKLRTKRVDISNVFRIRHTKAGRDYFQDGTKGEGKEAW